MFRRMLEEQISRVERGEFPTVAVIRDPKKNESISFESTTRPVGGTAGLTVFDLHSDYRTKIFK
jgi:hypothetical protein